MDFLIYIFDSKPKESDVIFDMIKLPFKITRTHSSNPPAGWVMGATAKEPITAEQACAGLVHWSKQLSLTAEQPGAAAVSCSRLQDTDVDKQSPSCPIV